MTGVQLIGKEKVLERFDTFQAANEADAWGLFQGKEFIAGGVGSDTLDGWLTSFEQTASTATYKLRIYDSSEPPTSSTANSDYLACFSFKVVDQYEGYGIGGYSNKLMDRIGALEKQLKEKKQDEEDSEDLGSIVMGWLQDPVKLNQVAGAVRQIFGIGEMQSPMITATPVGAAIAGFNVTKDEDPEANLTRVAGALDKLEKKDPKLTDHLEKLAKLSEANPALFNTVISQLDLL